MTYYPRAPPSNSEFIISEQKRIEDIGTTNEDKRRVLLWLSRVPASFVSEICWEIGMGEVHVKTTLSALHNEGLVEEIHVDQYIPDPRLMHRVPDQSAKGQGGFANFSKKRWISITSEGRAWLKAA